jgi:serine/threonine protein kinase
MPFKDGQSPCGTIKYMSVNTHRGIEQSRRDDIETIGYVLVYLLKGMLPWQNIKSRDDKDRYRMIMDRKLAMTAEDLCLGYPLELAQLINYARNL